MPRPIEPRVSTPAAADPTCGGQAPEVDSLRREYAHAVGRLANVTDENIKLRRELARMHASASWRVTAPIRALRRSLTQGIGAARLWLRQWPNRSLLAIYHRAPISMSARRKLHQVLFRFAPQFYARLRLITGASVPQNLEEAIAARTGSNDIVGVDAFRTAFRRLIHVLADHTRMHGRLTHVIVLPFFAIGGAQVVAQNLARAVIARGGGCLIVAADRRLDAQVNEIPNGALAVDLSDYFEGADAPAREQLLFALARIVRPQVLHIINSEIGWRLVIKEGARLRSFARLFGCIFAFQYDWRTGDKVGYAATFLRPALPQLDGLITDNRRFVQDAINDFELQHERGKFHVLYNAVEGTNEVALKRGQMFAASLPARIRAATRMSVLWAGRLDAEKRPELLRAVAAACPDMDFHVYGARVVDSEWSVQIERADNIHLHGNYKSPEEVGAAREHHAMMFTSRWEGLANVLIEFGAQGLPVVAATVGGVGELITTETGYPVPERPAAADYVEALQAIRARPDVAQRKAECLIQLIGVRHSRPAFDRTLAQIPGYFK